VVLPKYASCHIDASISCENNQPATIETVFIEGHTDETGNDVKNWMLSTERAVNTYRELIRIAPTLRSLKNRRNQEIISVSGYSATRPISVNHDRDAYSVNRRIDLRFVMETDSREGLKQILQVTSGMRDQIERLRKASGVAP
jgi:hypothetical protein